MEVMENLIVCVGVCVCANDHGNTCIEKFVKMCMCISVGIVYSCVPIRLSLHALGSS